MGRSAAQVARLKVCEQSLLVIRDRGRALGGVRVWVKVARVCAVLHLRHEGGDLGAREEFGEAEGAEPLVFFEVVGAVLQAAIALGEVSHKHLFDQRLCASVEEAVGRCEGEPGVGRG